MVHTDELELWVAWQRAVGSAELFGRLLARYDEPHRRYHGRSHLRWIIRHVTELCRLDPDADEAAVIAAAFFHDAVFRADTPADEQASARLAEGSLLESGWAVERARHVAAMIQATAGHHRGDTGIDTDTRVLLDADLAILGADPSAYQAYVTGVRAEFGHLDEASWRRGRAAFVSAMLDQPSIFRTTAARTRWEHRARANLTAELAALR